MYRKKCRSRNTLPLQSLLSSGTVMMLVHGRRMAGCPFKFYATKTIGQNFSRRGTHCRLEILMVDANKVSPENGSHVRLSAPALRPIMHRPKKCRSRNNPKLLPNCSNNRQKRQKPMAVMSGCPSRF